MARLKRTLAVLWALALALAIVIPALPGAWQGAWTRPLIDVTHKIGVSQRWAMYAPDPQRGLAYLSVRGVWADGHEEEIDDSSRRDNAWTRQWDWDKRRRDIWRAYAALSPKSGSNPDRTWYVKSLCIGEARSHGGEAPTVLHVDRLTRSFTHPDKVRAGAPEFGPVTRTPVQKISCAYRPIRDAIAEDEARHGSDGSDGSQG